MKNNYKCSYCGKIVSRESDKMWVESYCEETDKRVRLQKVKKPKQITTNSIIQSKFKRISEKKANEIWLDYSINFIQIPELVKKYDFNPQAISTVISKKLKTLKT